MSLTSDTSKFELRDSYAGESLLPILQRSSIFTALLETEAAPQILDLGNFLRHHATFFLYLPSY